MDRGKLLVELWMHLVPLDVVISQMVWRLRFDNSTEAKYRESHYSSRRRRALFRYHLCPCRTVAITLSCNWFFLLKHFSFLCKATMQVANAFG